jgi:hypothetical protein
MEKRVFVSKWSICFKVIYLHSCNYGRYCNYLQQMGKSRFQYNWSCSVGVSVNEVANAIFVLTSKVIIGAL